MTAAAEQTAAARGRLAAALDDAALDDAAEATEQLEMTRGELAAFESKGKGASPRAALLRDQSALLQAVITLDRDVEELEAAEKRLIAATHAKLVAALDSALDDAALESVDEAAEELEATRELVAELSSKGKGASSRAALLLEQAALLEVVIDLDRELMELARRSVGEYDDA